MNPHRAYTEFAVSQKQSSLLGIAALGLGAAAVGGAAVGGIAAYKGGKKLVSAAKSLGGHARGFAAEATKPKGAGTSRHNGLLNAAVEGWKSGLQKNTWEKMGKSGSRVSEMIAVAAEAMSKKAFDPAMLATTYPAVLAHAPGIAHEVGHNISSLAAKAKGFAFDVAGHAADKGARGYADRQLELYRQGDPVAKAMAHEHIEKAVKAWDDHAAAKIQAGDPEALRQRDEFIRSLSDNVVAALDERGHLQNEKLKDVVVGAGTDLINQHLTARGLFDAARRTVGL